ncbi:N-terminal glutamine amidase-domain-containing protein [Trametes elegans]|nr:N-terminal glutamine amidase-domain-containing protein [Trametes elegans]
MSNSVLSSFDPLATHPFTNNSGLMPKPSQPSQYPHPSPSKTASATGGQGPIILTTTPVHAPQPKRAVPKSSSSAPKPIFVPFRPERSSPDLEDILLKKKFADAFQGKRSWGIDHVPLPSAVPSPAKQGRAHVYTSYYCEENVYLLAQMLTQLLHTDSRGGLWQVFVVFISNSGKTVALWSQKARDGVVVWDYHVVLVLVSRTPLNTQDGSETPVNGAPPPAPSQVLPDSSAERQAWVYDFDTTLPMPCSWTADYIAGTFPYVLDGSLAGRVDEMFHRCVFPVPVSYFLFRVIPADVYLDHFASDRSHMIVPAIALRAQGESGAGAAGSRTEPPGGIRGASSQAADESHRYSSPPPPYPPLCGAKARAMGIVNNLMDSFVAMGSSALRAGGEAAGLSREAEAEEDAAAQYGQVMDLGAFVRWLTGSQNSEA